MKIFILYEKENWITDQLAKEWIKYNAGAYTDNPATADIIWILSNYIIGRLPYEMYKRKKVITTIHHIVPWKFNNIQKTHYYNLNEITDVFHSICARLFYVLIGNEEWVFRIPVFISGVLCSLLIHIFAV